MKRWILASIIFVFCFFTQSSVAEDLDKFQPPSREFTDTKYAKDCGGVSVSLKEEMPPIEDQMQSPWCATFAAKALVDFEIYKNNPALKYSKRISPMDLNALNSKNSTNNWGVVPSFEEGGNAFTILEGLQKNKTVYTEDDYPFDMALFDKDRLLYKLSKYYDDNKIFADHSAMECRDINSLLLETSLEIPGLSELLKDSDSKGSFLKRLKEDHSLAVGAKQGAKRMDLIPSFDIRNFQSFSGDQAVEEIKKNLANRSPTVIGVCANQLVQIPGLSSGVPVPPALKNTCGSHSIVVTGMQPKNGKCMLQIRNSWGTDWPSPEQGGYGEVSLNEILSVVHPVQGALPLQSISKSKTPGKIKNEIVYKEFYYVGDTWRLLQNGQGKIVDKNKNTWIGTFENQIFIKGTYEGMIQGMHYKGEYTRDGPEGTGELTDNESYFRGTFKHGSPVTGYFKGMIDDETFFEGMVVNGVPSSDGKFTKLKK